MSDRKRPLETNGEGSNKKAKTDTSTNGSSGSGTPLTGAALIAQKRAEIAAKMEAMKNSAHGSRAASTTKLPAKPAFSPSPAASTPSKGSPAPPPSIEELNKRVADAKRRVADAQVKLGTDLTQQAKAKGRATPAIVEPAPQGSGLKMAAHPLLLDQTPTAPQSKKDRYKPMQPKFASIKANVRNQPTPPPAPTPVPVIDNSNPYLAAAASAKDTGFEGAPRERTGRQIRLNAPGKYVAMGNQLRQEQKLEALKQRIAESARKAGLDGDMGIEKTIKRPAPPDAEWWDAGLLPNQTYDDLDLGFETLKITTTDSPITMYIQHPIPIPAPGDKNTVALKPMMLTKKEQKKMRKLKRASDLQDKRDRIRMGLLPPDPPKVRLANLMKVLTSDAIQDPTRVEAKVRREVAMRKHNHEKTNAERKLTDDQRREKVEDKKHTEEKKGIHGAVFKVKKLSDPSHQFKVRRNAEQNALTGVCIFNPNFSMVYVEGAAKYLRAYKRLMMHRIVWTEAARARDDVEIDDTNSEAANAAGPSTAAPEGSGENTDSLEDNKCYLIWEGLLRDRSFNQFKVRSCPTDASAKDVLGDKLKGYWDQAKNWKPEEEEFYS